MTSKREKEEFLGRHFLMIKTHNATGLKYLCKAKNRDPWKYRGSGIRWLNHLAAHGKDDFTTEIVREFTNNEDLAKFATKLSAELQVDTSEDWANLVPETGGGGSTSRSNGSKGKKWSDESRRRLSEALAKSPKVKSRVQRAARDVICDFCGDKINGKGAKAHMRRCHLNPDRDRHFNEKYYLFGDTEHTLEEIAELSGVSVSTLRNRLWKGQTIDEAASYPKENHLLLETSEGWVGTINQFSQEFGISHKSVRSLLKKQFSPDQIIEYVMTIEGDGKLFCDTCGSEINSSRFIGSHFHYCTLIKGNSHPSAELFSFKGERLSLRQIAQVTNIAHKTLVTRIFGHGMALESAIEKGRSQKVLYEFENKQVSISELSRLTGFTVKQLRTRIKVKGMSVSAALQDLKAKS